MSAGDRKEAVWKLVLNPMQEMFPAPTHLRANEAAKREALRVYEAALIGFGDEVLKAAWEQVGGNRDVWCWPASGVLRNACREAQRLTQVRDRAKQDELVDKANDLAGQYAKNFMKRSTVAARAKAEGWDGPLKAYLFEVAWVQAQFLVGVRQVGYSGGVLKGTPPAASQDVREQADQFLQNAKEQAAKGSVRVHVPHTLIERWRTEYRGRGPAVPGPGSRS